MAENRPIRLWVRLEPGVTEKLDRYVEHRDVTRSRLMREIIEEWLGSRPSVPEGPPLQNRRTYDQSAYMKSKLSGDGLHPGDPREDAMASAIRVRLVLWSIEDQLDLMKDALEKAVDGIACTIAGIQQRDMRDVLENAVGGIGQASSPPTGVAESEPEV